MRPQDRTRAIALSGLSSTAKLVAVMLADCCNSADSGWPSVPTLGDRCSLNERTVRRVLAEAEADGWIQRQDRRGTSSIFRLNLSALPAKSASDTPGTRSGADREASPDRGSAPDPGQPRIVDPPTPDPQSPNPGSWIREPRIVDPPKRSEASTEAIREAFSDARETNPTPRPDGEGATPEPTRCHAPAVPSSIQTPERASPPSPAGPTSSPTTDASATPALATLPAAPPLPIPTATPTSTATETPNPSPSAPTAGEPSGSCSAGSPITTAPAVAPGVDPVPAIRLPSPTRAAKLAQLRSALARLETTLTTLRKFGGETTSAEREAERVRLQIATLEASDVPDEPVAAPAPPPRPAPVTPPRPPPPRPEPEPEPAPQAAAPTPPEPAPVALQAVLLPATTRSSPPVVRNDSGAIGAHERNAVPALAGPDTSPLTVVGIGGVPVTLPGDLPGLLDFDAAIAGWLVSGGVETTRHLLEYTEAEIQMVPRMGTHRARRIARHLRERWGIEPGCLARRTPDPKSRTGAAAIGLGRFLSRHGGES